ncbi:MAG: bifunctional nuclease family protein [Candidatus Nanopelagicales bacterium]
MDGDAFVAVEVVGVRVEMPSNSPIVLVREGAGHLHLPIWIGPSEAAAIAMALQEVKAPRPLTHDLFVATLAKVGAPLRAVRVTRLEESVFYGELVFDGVVVDARPSDAIALALRAGVPILVAREVLAEAGVRLEPEPEDEVDEVARFREFLDNVSPQDFQ